MKNVKLLVAAALLLASALALALDAPHDGSWQDSVTECQSCHQLHGSTGGTLTKWPSNNDACLTCHDGVSAPPNNLFASAWSASGAEAAPGTGGVQHKWSGSATALGARLPVNPENADIAVRLSGGLQCAACHDEHGKKDLSGVPIQATLAPSSAHASYKFLDFRPPLTGSGSLGLVSITAASSWAPPVRAATYTVKVTSVAGSSGVMAVSHDYSTVTGTGTWVDGLPFTVNGDSELDDANVLVRFVDPAPSVGAIWQFYVSYPFLRASNVADAMCLDCHANRHQGYRCVEGDPAVSDGAGINCAPDGVRTYSHPVNEPLGANGAGIDLGAPLDADGATGSSVADGEGAVPNPSNDLVLDAGMVRCTTCHAPHNADSNSLTVDVR